MIKVVTPAFLIKAAELKHLTTHHLSHLADSASSRKESYKKIKCKPLILQALSINISQENESVSLSVLQKRRIKNE